MLNCKNYVLFPYTYSNQKILHGSNQSHVSNISDRYEVPTTSGNIFIKTRV